MTDCFYRMGLRGWILIFAVTLVAAFLGFSKHGVAAGGGDYTATPTIPPAIAKAQKYINKNDFEGHMPSFQKMKASIRIMLIYII